MDLLFHDLKIIRFSYESPFPFGLREALRITWTNDQNQKLISDICPLPGYSAESIDDIYSQLLKIKAKTISDDELFPSLHFAVHHPIVEGDPIQPQRYQALIQNGAKSLSSFQNELYSSVKIKTSGLLDDEIIRFIKRYEKNLTIRLDAQRTPLSQKLLSFLLEHPESYDYIEEPILNSDTKNLKIALDETLYIEKNIPELINLSALIYKPTLIGCFTRLPKCHKSVPIILSSCYETTLGLKQIIKFHQIKFPKADWDIGIDTFPLQDPFVILEKEPPYVKQVKA